MDILQHFPDLSWCKPNWSLQNRNEETNELLQQCTKQKELHFTDDIEEVISRSKSFAIPFPIASIRLETLKLRRPIERLKKNIISTYPIIHERVLLLMAQFLIYKREFGSDIEKALYKDMSVPDLIDRILKKRALVFMTAHDKYKLITGEQSREGWEEVGTPKQKSPLLLDNVLSYDEMKIASMVYVSGPTECINDGERRNTGVVREDDIETNAIIIGIVGPRFKRKNRMEYEDIVISEEQNVDENGYGKGGDQAKQRWRKLWMEFYQSSDHIYEELKSKVKVQDKPAKKHIDRFVNIPKSSDIFDNEVYYKRLCVTVESVLIEAEDRAREQNKDGFVNVIGAGLGVWKVSPHQCDVFIITFLERLQHFLEKGLLDHVTDVNFAYIKPLSDGVLSLFENPKMPNTKGRKKSTEKMATFLKKESHPKGGINVQIHDREPSSKLTGEHEGKLLILTYPWDGNAHPGNEFWIGKLSSSGDPAAACSTQVAELHNAHVNWRVCGDNARVLARTGVHSIRDYCREMQT